MWGGIFKPVWVRALSGVAPGPPVFFRLHRLAILQKSILDLMRTFIHEKKPRVAGTWSTVESGHHQGSRVGHPRKKAVRDTRPVESSEKHSCPLFFTLNRMGNSVPASDILPRENVYLCMCMPWYKYVLCTLFFIGGYHGCSRKRYRPPSCKKSRDSFADGKGMR